MCGVASLIDKMELIEVKTKRKGTNKCTIPASKNSFFIPKGKMEELGWQNGERVNLYVLGTTFALKPDKVGLMRVRTTPSSGTTCIYSSQLCLELLSRTRSCREYECWTEGNILVFRPEGSDNE